MASAESTQVALGILQTVGLLLPVVFLTLRSRVFEDDREPCGDVVVEMSPETGEEQGNAPLEVQGGYYIVIALAIAGGLAGIELLLSASISLVVAGSLSALLLAFLFFVWLFEDARSS